MFYDLKSKIKMLFKQFFYSSLFRNKFYSISMENVSKKMTKKFSIWHYHRMVSRAKKLEIVLGIQYTTL